MVIRSGAVGAAALVFSFLLVSSATLPCLADAYYDQGLRLYRQRNFRQAAQYFDQAMRNNPSDSNAAYYDALSYHQLGDWARAKAAYKDVVTKFPGSPAGANALAALQQLDPNYVRQMSGGSSGGRSASASTTTSYSAPVRSSDPDLANCPDEDRIPFTKEQDALMVNVEINGRMTKMVFDTGAASSFIGKNQLRDLALPVPQGPPTSAVGGSGAGTVGCWIMPVTMKLGHIERHNMPMMVSESNPSDPLVGQTFFKDLEYSVDNGARCIVVHKKGAGGRSSGSGSSAYDVPFTFEVRGGNKMVVNVEINGRPYPVWFDTGNSASALTLYEPDIRRLGITIPEDAQNTASLGVTGVTPTKVFTVNRLKLGPIDRSNVEVKVNLTPRDESGRVTASSDGRPLLGQGFYGSGWQYTVDNDRKVIHFIRR